MNSRLLPVLVCCLAGLLPACGDTEQPLWSGPAPDARGSAKQDVPTLMRFGAPGTNAAPAVIVCPGGGYQGHTLPFEGDNVALWLQSRGVTAFVLRYRLPKNGYLHPVPLHDLQRALRLVRAQATDWNIDPTRVGVIGFSAGGHLVTTASTHFDDGNSSAPDPADRPGCRPDFCIAVYPVVSFVSPHTHVPSRNKLLGPQPDPALLTELSAEKQVTPRTPPTLLVHSMDDAVVPPGNSLDYFAALRAAGVPAELHLYDTGGHGFAVGRKNDPAPRDWLVPIESWMRRHGWMP